jgi:hypothetical protein
MPDGREELREKIRRLSPEALQLFKRQLAALPEQERQKAFSRLAGIPELADIVGRPPRVGVEEPPPPRQEVGDIPLWRRGLQAFAAPFQFIHERAIEPFAATVTAPFTPAVPGAEDLGWLERQRLEYEKWKAPFGVKFAIETLPWLAIPSVGGIAGRVGALAARAGRARPAVEAIAKGVEYSPWGLAEKGATAVTTPVLRRATAGARRLAAMGRVPEERVLPKSRLVSPEELPVRTEAMPKRVQEAVEEAAPPPVKPPTEVKPKEPDEFDRFWEAVSGKEGERAWDVTQRLRAEERARRAAVIGERIEMLSPEERTLENITKIWQELGAGPLPYQATEMGFPLAFRDEGIRKITEALADRPYEMKATIGAFVRALEGRPVPRVPGVKGGSAYSRLARVFGKEVADIFTSREKLTQAAEKFLEPRPPSREVAAYLRELSDIPQGQADLFGQFVQKGAEQAPSLDPFDPNILRRSSEEIMERLGYGKVRDPRSEAQKALDYAALRYALLRAEGKVPPGILGEFPAFPSEKAVRQLAYLPKETRERIADALTSARLNIVDALNMPRAILASADISAMLRQGAVASARHPVAAAKFITPMLRSIFRPKYALERERWRLTHPSVQKFLRPSLQHKLEFTALPEEVAPLSAREESFMSTLATRIPVLGAVIRGSARAFSTFLNDIRAHMAIDADTKLMEMARKAGLQPTDVDYSEFAKLINVATGRGSLGPFNRHAPVFNTVFFAPRLLVARLQWPTMIFSPSKEVRVEAWRQIGSFLAAMGTILAAARLSGASDIELDPRSADFGKIKYEDTRLDIWGGYVQYIRFISQLVAAQRKTAGGYLLPFRRGEVASRFMQSKLSPAAGLINDILRGQTYLGEEFPPKSATSVAGQVYNRMFPLAIQDMIDGFIQSGALSGLVASTGLLGVGVVTYMDEVNRAREKAARREYGMSWDEVGKTYGRIAQLRLEQTDPKIIEALKEQEMQYSTASPTVFRQFFEMGQDAENLYRKEVELAAKEFRATGDGRRFRERVDAAAQARRLVYAERAKKEKFQDIIAQYQKPLTPEERAKMNPGDIARREYIQLMFAPDMWDEFGRYRREEAAKREREFLARFGQAALDYIEQYSADRWLDEPKVLKVLKQAREVLRPYWRISDLVWSMYPSGLKSLSDRIQQMEEATWNPSLQRRAKMLLRRYPQILRARELIATYRKRMRDTNPAIRWAIDTFYR